MQLIAANAMLSILPINHLGHFRNVPGVDNLTGSDLSR
jgi:hypothetical protein